MKPHLRIGLIPVMIALAVITGCSKNETQSAPTQVAAKVNSTEITISQINNVLARTNVAPEAAERAKREILDKLIDTELAKQAAMDKKLDRTPNVLQAIESAKTEILARAYLEQFAAGLPRPTPDEVKKYYADHPELFSERRIYSIEEISVPAKEGLAATLREQIGKSHTLQDVGAWLKSQGIPFNANSGVRAAEQLPLEYLPQMQTMKDGEMRVFEVAGGVQVIRVAASKSDPVDEAHATPRIQQFLFGQSSRDAIDKEMKQIKEKAKIEYVGEFATSAAEAEAKDKAEADAKAKAQADAKAKADAETQAQEDAVAKARQAADAKDQADADARAKDEEASRARRAADAKAQEAGSKGAQQKGAQPLTPDIQKGLRGVIQ